MPSAENDVPLRYHATVRDLSGQAHLLPPSLTGVEPTWEGMDPREQAQVFMSPTLEAAHGWGGELGDGYRVYEVVPEGDVEDHVHTQAAPRARILRCVFPPDGKRS